MARKKRTSEGSNDNNGSASRISLAAIEQDGSDSYLCSEWTMNVAAKVILIVFGALVGHCLTILFPQSENWTISLWNHHGNIIESQELTLIKIERLLQGPVTQSSLSEVSSMLQSASKLQFVGRQEAWWMILRGIGHLKLDRSRDALDYCNKGLLQLSKVSSIEGTPLSKKAFSCIASSYEKLNVVEAAIDSHISSIHCPFNSSDIFERTIHENSVLKLSNLYLLPEVNRAQRVLDLIVQQINDRHISPRWLQSAPLGPLSCVYGRAVLLLEHSAGDGCTINAANHTFYFQLEEQKILKNVLHTIEQNPDEVEAHKDAAISFLRLGSPARSLSAVKVALSLQPNDLASLILCGEAAEQQAKFEEASKCYQKAYEEIKSRRTDSEDHDLSLAKTQVFHGLKSWARMLLRQNEFSHAYLVLLRCQLLQGYSSELTDMIDIAKSNMGFDTSSAQKNISSINNTLNGVLSNSNYSATIDSSDSDPSRKSAEVSFDSSESDSVLDSTAEFRNSAEEFVEKAALIDTGRSVSEEQLRDDASTFVDSIVAATENDSQTSIDVNEIPPELETVMTDSSESMSIDGADPSTSSISLSEPVDGQQHIDDDFTGQGTPIETDTSSAEEQLQGIDQTSAPSLDNFTIDKILNDPSLPGDEHLNLTSAEQPVIQLQQIVKDSLFEATTLSASLSSNDSLSILPEDNSAAASGSKNMIINDMGSDNAVVAHESIHNATQDLEPEVAHMNSTNVIMHSGDTETQASSEVHFSAANETVEDFQIITAAHLSSLNTTQNADANNYTNNSSLLEKSPTQSTMDETALRSAPVDQGDSMQSNETSSDSNSQGSEKPVESTKKTPLVSAEDAARIRIASPLMKMADAYLSQGQYDMAIKQLTKALKKAPSYADAYFLRAKLYEAKGDYERSTADYLKIFSDLDPTNRTVFSKLLSTAMTYSYGGKYSQSVPILDKIIKNVEEVFIFPRDTELFTTVSTSLAVAHAKLNNSHDAIKALEAAEPALVSLATANFSDSAELESLISQRSQLYSQLFESTGQIDKAESALRKSHEQKLISWNDLGEFYFRYKMYMKAIDCFKQYLQELNSTSTSGAGSRGRKGLFSSHSSSTNDKLIALTHKRIGSSYQRLLLDEDCSPSKINNCSLNITETVEIVDTHFSKAMQLGLDDKEIRRFFALHTTRTSESVDLAEISSRNDSDSDSDSDNHTVHEVNVANNVIEGIPQSTVNDSTDNSPLISTHESGQQLSNAITHRRRSSQHRWVIRQLVNESIATNSSLSKLTRPPLVDVNSILQMSSVSPVPANIRDALSALETPAQAAAQKIESGNVKSSQMSSESVRPTMKVGGMANSPLVPPIAVNGARESSPDSAKLTAFEQQLLVQEELQEQEELMEQKTREAMARSGTADSNELSEAVAALMRQMNG